MKQTIKKAWWLVLLTLIAGSLMPLTAVQAQSVTAADLVGTWKTKLEVVNAETYGNPRLTAGQIQEFANSPQQLVFTESGGNLYLTPSQPPVPQIPITLSGNEFNANHIRKIGSETYNLVVYGRVSKRGTDIDLTVIISGTIIAENQDDVMVFYFTHTANTASRTVDVTSDTVAPVTPPSGTEVGRVTFIQGRTSIQRADRIIQASVGEGIMAGDTLINDSGEMTVVLDNITYRILPGTRFIIPEEVREVKTNYIQSVIKGYWQKTKEFLAGESFEVRTPTATCGVRG